MIRALLLSGALCALALGPADVQSQIPSICQNPEGFPVECIEIKKCTPIVNLLMSEGLHPQTKQLLLQSRCGLNGTEPMVCCVRRRANGNASLVVPPRKLKHDFSNNTLLPSDCGKDEAKEMLNGSFAGINEFPWMALLEYEMFTGQKTIRCSGVLISKRYVLTAAHCILPRYLSVWARKLVSVRLGEFNVRRDPDCVQDGEDIICADKDISVDIEDQIIHEGYFRYSPFYENDVALLRLSRDVETTAYVKPICLPPTASLGEKLYISGWGQIEHQHVSPLKRKQTVLETDTKACVNAYYSLYRIRLGEDLFCTDGKLQEEYCGGFSFDGGPLMGFQRDKDGNGRWTCVGIYSLGSEECEEQKYPRVYTRVIDFIPWILGKLKP